MGVLTSGMTRLTDEIRGMRKMRGAFIKELERETADLKAAVSDMRGKFSIAHSEMARRMRADGLAFLSDLKQAVGGLRGAVRADIAGARLARFGLLSAESLRMRRDAPEESSNQGPKPKGQKRK